jgi:tellurite resistance protein TehA-like permease
MATGLGARWQHALRGLAPSYFALVMGSGIISVGLLLRGQRILSEVLLVIVACAYVVLLMLTGWRVLAHRDAVASDFTDPRRGFGFFTLVAATNALGARLALGGHHAIAAVLLAAGIVLWLVLGYVVPWTAALGPQRRPVIAAANGTWFIWVVASQSVAVAAASLEPVYSSTRHLLAVVAVFSWSVGVFLYAAAGIFVAARIMLYELKPEELTPPYWVAMGASAITVTAGADIVKMADAPMVDVTRGLIAGVSVMFWAFATWLIPVLVAAGWWRHVAHRVRLTYDASWWAVIFPLGMYAVASIVLGRADQLSLVGDVGKVELWVAFAAWLVAMAVMIVHVTRTVLLPGAEEQPEVSASRG